MQIKWFQPDKDLQKLEAYLRNQYFWNKNMTSWLPERLHDLIYRMSAQEADGGREKSMDHIFLWEENGEIVACILPDGENIYISIKNGFEQLFRSVLAYSEKNCLPLFRKAEDGSVKFWVAANDSLTYMREILLESGYERYAEEDYDNCVYPLVTSVSADLPEGFKLLYGEEYADEEKKWSACSLGFHPVVETTEPTVEVTEPVCIPIFQEKTLPCIRTALSALWWRKIPAKKTMSAPIALSMLINGPKQH